MWGIGGWVERDDAIVRHMDRG